MTSSAQGTHRRWPQCVAALFVCSSRPCQHLLHFIVASVGTGDADKLEGSRSWARLRAGPRHPCFRPDYGSPPFLCDKMSTQDRSEAVLPERCTEYPARSAPAVVCLASPLPGSFREDACGSFWSMTHSSRTELSCESNICANHLTHRPRGTTIHRTPSPRHRLGLTADSRRSRETHLTMDVVEMHDVPPVVERFDATQSAGCSNSGEERGRERPWWSKVRVAGICPPPRTGDATKDVENPDERRKRGSEPDSRPPHPPRQACR